MLENWERARSVRARTWYDCGDYDTDTEIMNLLNRDRYRKKLQHLLSRSDDRSFLQMVWAINAIQSKRSEFAAPYLQFPIHAATSEITSPHAIHKWELETLVNQLLITKKYQKRTPGRRVVNCGEFQTGATAVNYLRKLEDAEFSLHSKGAGILNEIRRIGHRQFPWQRGYFDIAQIYRYAYIYGQEKCSRFLKSKFDLTPTDLLFVGLSLYICYQTNPSVPLPFSMESVVNSATIEAALSLLCAPIARARTDALALLSYMNEQRSAPIPTAFNASYLRRAPIIKFADGILHSPLPELIVLRVTAGLFYDLLGAEGDVRNEASQRFEQYSAKYISAMMPKFEVTRSYSYIANGNKIETPDILIRQNSKIIAVVECKARKMSYAAQFGNYPEDEAKSGFDEIAKGVFQIWRFFSHARRGVFVLGSVGKNAHGLVLTLEPWLQVSGELRKNVLYAATELAKKDVNIILEDCRPIVFCSAQDIESSLAQADEELFLHALDNAVMREFDGWDLSAIVRETKGHAPTKKFFPFKLAEVLPWWTTIEDMEGHRNSVLEKS